MLAKLAWYTLVGIDATPVEVEVDVSFSSMPKTVLVGLLGTAVRSQWKRVQTRRSGDEEDLITPNVVVRRVGVIE